MKSPLHSFRPWTEALFGEDRLLQESEHRHVHRTGAGRLLLSLPLAAHRRSLAWPKQERPKPLREPIMASWHWISCTLPKVIQYRSRQVRITDGIRQGSQELPISWSRIASIGAVSYTSNTPQNAVGNCFGPCISCKIAVGRCGCGYF